jgi:hypothetical protein
MAVSITQILNYWNAIGVFSYVLPFLLIFAVVYAILSKSGILQRNKGINTIVAASIGLLALQYDQVPLFFANVFPKFGILLSLVLVILLLMGFAGFNVGTDNNNWKYIGLGAAVIVVVWALYDFAWFGGPGFSIGFWLYNEYLWSLLILAAVGGAIYFVTKEDKGGGGN